MNSGRKRRAQKLFIKARKLSPDARAAFLEKQCGDDAELREAVEHRLRNAPSKRLPESGNAENKIAASLARPGTPRAAPESHPGEANRGWATRLFGGPFRRMLAVCLTLAVLAGLAIGGHHRIQVARNGQLTDHLLRALNANAQAMDIGVREQLNLARVLAADTQLRGLLEELAEITSGDIELGQPLWDEDSRNRLRELLQFSAQREAAYVLCFKNQDGTLVAESPQWIGRRPNLSALDRINEVFEGGTSLTGLSSKPDPLAVGEAVETGKTEFYAMAPVRGESGEIIAGLGIRQSGARAWPRLLNAARAGTSWRNFVFDSAGRVIAESSSYNEESLLRPGVSNDRSPRLLQGLSGNPAPFQSARMEVRLQPYPDYRGTNVIGAWRWLPEYDLGLAAEMDAAEALTPWRHLRMGAGALLLVLAFSMFSVLFCAFAMARLPVPSPRAEEPGQYTLMEKTGERGFAEIYLAKHPVLLKPVSMHILNPEILTPDSMKRLERDVPIAGQLAHPNTAEIYDFGKTPYGAFFCVTEYVAGHSFEEWVRREGTVCPERVVFILRQVCESLAEAHAARLPHRSIKPSSLMLCRRGGQSDFVKVMDYGLSVEAPEEQSYEITAPGLIPGDLAFVAPEGVRGLLEVDARGDIYSLGAVAYYLLAGKHLFELTNNLDLQVKIVNERPIPLTEAASQRIPKELDELVSACLRKDPAQRPRDVAEILNALDELQPHLPWSQTQARECWERYGREEDPNESSENVPKQ